MKIAILGGTGKEGKALARRWALAGNTIFIGSRQREKALRIAEELSQEIRGGRFEGGTNEEAAEKGEVVVLAVTSRGHRGLLLQMRDRVQGKVVIDVTVPLHPQNPTRLAFPVEGSAAQEAQTLLGPDVNVVGALHNLSAHRYDEAENPIDCDALVCGDDAGAKQVVLDLVRELGVRAIDAGSLENAVFLEGMTAVLLGINRRYGVKAACVEISGLPHVLKPVGTRLPGTQLSQKSH
ncbi:MAG: NADPH-dependent F420 reductase [Candidatus Tectomicrobia bacterium]|uniref:NADPH-dependent F420 reductase n=1 Tax=Tectimicrobiota bacterium TaxID=2528274 RepID=A0A932GPH0_UNCTE|nr:NADPH-dependent F420 reductase [Candidatus Tectomicrobia bacterium]